MKDSWKNKNTENNELPSNHYVDNQRLLKELTVHLKERKQAMKKGEPIPQIPYYVAYAFIEIAEGLAKLKSYRNYSFVNEMKGDAIENCMQYYHNFNPRKYKKPFAYFSQFARWAFHRRIAREAKAQYVKYKTAANAGLLDQGLTDSDGNAIISTGTFDNINEFITSYEKKMAEKKIAKSKPKDKAVKVRKTHVARQNRPSRARTGSNSKGSRPKRTST